jgi:hypothetical protein
MLLSVPAVFFSVNAYAQSRSSTRTETQTASNVSAELVKGKLSPAHSKPGDPVEMRLNSDVKSNGQLVLKKGTVVTGVVRSVKQVDQKSSAGQAQSMMDIEWFAPATQGASQVMFAVQSLSSINSFSQPTSDDVTEARFLSAGPVASTTSASANGQSNVALMKMPSIVAADRQTSSMIQHNLDLSGDQQIFRTGRGEVVSATGSRQSVDLFSRMANDTVVTSKNKDFEITSGATMQLAVGVKR